jgi:hypothetical protein
MLTRSEYEQAVQVFLVELFHLCDDASESELRALPRFAGLMDEYLADVRDPSHDAAQTLREAFALLDEYWAANRDKVLGAAYEQYQFGQSHRTKSD